MKKMIDYLNQSNKRIVSPIWDGKKEFHFLCPGHIDFCEAMGFEICQRTKVLRQVKENSIRDEKHLKEIIKRAYFNRSFVKRELDSLLEMKKNKKGLIGGGCFGPLTIASNLIGVQTMLRMILKNPEIIKQLVTYITTLISYLAEKEEQSGMDFFWIAEPLASLMSPQNFWEFSGQYLKKIYTRVDVPGFLHVCGQTLKHTKYMTATTAQVLSIDSVTPIDKCLEIVDKDVIIMGNLDPSVLKFGTIEEVRMECIRINESCSKYRNFVMSTGCSIMDDTPMENMEEMFRTTAGY